DRLILADRPIEDDTLLGVLHGAVEGGAPDPDRLDAGEHALGIERVQDVIEPAAHLADHVVFGNLQAVDEDLVAVHGRAPELFDLLHGDPLAIELSEEEGEVAEGLLRIALAGAGEEQNVSRVLRVRVPDLAAVDDEAVPLVDRAGLYP